MLCYVQHVNTCSHRPIRSAFFKIKVFFKNMLLFIFQYGHKTDKLAQNMLLYRLTYLEYV